MEKNENVPSKPTPQKILTTKAKDNLPIIERGIGLFKDVNRDKIILLVCYVAGSQSGKSFLVSKFSYHYVALGRGKTTTAECESHPDMTVNYIIHVDTEGFSTNNKLPVSVDRATSGFTNNQFRGPALNKFIPRFSYMLGSTFVVPVFQADPPDKLSRTLSFLDGLINSGFPKIALLIVWNAPSPWSPFYDNSEEMWTHIKQGLTNDDREKILQLFETVKVIAIPDMQANVNLDQQQDLLHFLSSRAGAPLEQAAPPNSDAVLVERCSQMLEYYQASIRFKRFTTEQTIKLMDWSIAKLNDEATPLYKNFIKTIIDDDTISTILEQTFPFFHQLQPLAPSKDQYVRAIKLSLPVLMAKTPIKEPSVMLMLAEKFLAQVKKFEPCCTQHPRVNSKVCHWTREFHPDYHSEDQGMFSRFKKIPNASFHSTIDDQLLHKEATNLVKALIAEPWQDLVETANSIGPIISTIVRANSSNWNSKLCLCCSAQLTNRILYGCGHYHICLECIKLHFTEDKLRIWRPVLELVNMKPLVNDLSLSCKICIFKESAASETTVALILKHPRIFDPSIRFGLGRTERVAPFQAISHKIVLFNGRGSSFKATVKPPPQSNDYVLFVNQELNVPHGQMADVNLSLVILKEDLELCVPLHIQIDNYVLQFNLIARTHGLLLMENQFTKIIETKPKDSTGNAILRWVVGENIYFYERLTLPILNDRIVHLNTISRQLEIRMNNYFAPILGIDVRIENNCKAHGKPLKYCVKSYSNLSKVSLIRQILEELEVLHAHGIYFPDIDLDNIIVRADDQITFATFPYANNHDGNNSEVLELEALGALIYQIWTGSVFVPTEGVPQSYRIPGEGQTVNPILSYCFNPDLAAPPDFLIQCIGQAEDFIRSQEQIFKPL